MNEKFDELAKGDGNYEPQLLNASQAYKTFDNRTGSLPDFVSPLALGPRRTGDSLSESTRGLMLSRTRQRFGIGLLLLGLIAGLALLLPARVTAQTLTTLHNFAGGGDGANPVAGLMLSGNTLYGTAFHGGILNRRAPWGLGAVFAVNTNGASFTILHSFTGDGMNPAAGLILSGNSLYGTASKSGVGYGTAFKIVTEGTAFTTLYTFGFAGGTDGADPVAGLVLSGNTLYGTALYSGSKAGGTVFAVNTDGTAFTPLHTFGGSDGLSPEAGLVLSRNILYGTTSSGGRHGVGTVFKVYTDGTGFKVLHSFTGSGDGANPLAGLILSGSTLFGTSNDGGGSGNGTVFAVSTDGTGFTTLYSFTGGSDGANPHAALILSDTTVYGTANGGGSSGKGTVFTLNTDGTGFTTLYSFTGGSDGANPEAGLILSGNTLYGTASNGGSFGKGTVFSLSSP